VPDGAIPIAFAAYVASGYLYFEVATVKERTRTPRRVTRRRGVARISSKNQITIPVETLRKTGLKSGSEVRIEAEGAGRIVVRRNEDAVHRYAGIFTGLYPKGYLKKLRGEWRY
jgi:AbrB family looped-hinge helix DNA binding protein